MDTISLPLLDKKQAAKLLNISLRMLEKLVRTQQIVPLRIGRRVLFIATYLEDYVAERMKRPERKRRKQIVMPEVTSTRVN